MSDHILLTKRLRVRQLRSEDLDWMARLHGDPQVMRYVREPDDLEQTRGRLRDLLEAAEREPQLGVWPLETLDNGAVIGWVVLTRLDGGEEIELGYRLFPEHWGKGYATEAACAVGDHALATLATDEIVAVARQENLASCRVLEKAGFERRGEREAYGVEDLAYFVRARTTP